MALIKSSSVDVSNARLAWGLACLSTWRKCNCDFNMFITFNSREKSVFSPGNIFVLNLNKLLFDCVKS